jgi:alkylation response protein AidB-like acyl-CoA dehydrogenase
MDFSFTEEQQMLLDTTRRFAAERCGFVQRQAGRATAEGFSRDAWKGLADLGLLALNVPERVGGLDAGPVENMIVATALGEALLPGPYLASAVLATRAIATLGSAVQQDQWLPGLADGSRIAVLAHDESDDVDGAITTTATRDGNGWRITGFKPAVDHAGAADLLLVSARVQDAGGDALALFAVPARHAGVTMQPFATVDAQRAADMTFADVQVDGDARVGSDVVEGLRAVRDFGIAMLCADAFGALDRILEATIEYTRGRVQFGVPIASFQALQHRMADMLMQVEQARSMTYLAASACDDTDAHRRAVALSAAKSLIGRAARFVGQQAVQLHGGMGMTDEMPVSHYFRRLLAFELRMGSSDRHLERYRRLT